MSEIEEAHDYLVKTIIAAIAEEREACAKIAEMVSVKCTLQNNGQGTDAAQTIRRLIRERGS